LPWLYLLFPLLGYPRLVHQWWWGPIFAIASGRNWMRLQRSNFDLAMEFLGAFFGMPVFAYLLLRSKWMHGKGTVAWKGRSYGTLDADSKNAASTQDSKYLMKISVIAIVVTLLAMGTNGSPLRAQITEDPHFLTTLIEPGHSLGPLKIGDSEEHARELFPKKDTDQEWEDACGTTIDWTDSANPNGHGEIFIRLKKGKVFQIESSTTRFHTAEDITTFDSPDKIRTSYKEMRAWVLLTTPSPAMGSRPPVFWIDKKRGIAFEFAYDVPHHKRYVYKVIIFQPNKTFCPEQETVDSLKWQALDPYRVEPPAELSPER
jgi:hypothetical protein